MTAKSATGKSGESGWIEDELGRRKCIWFKVDDADIGIAVDELGTMNIRQARMAWRLHPNTKWCEKYGNPCDEEGERHTHWEPVTGDPTHIAFWREEDEQRTPADTSITGVLAELASLLRNHQWSAAVGGCFGGTCRWHGGDAHNDEDLHSAHVAEVVLASGYWRVPSVDSLAAALKDAEASETSFQHHLSYHRDIAAKAIPALTAETKDEAHG